MNEQKGKVPHTTEQEIQDLKNKKAFGDLLKIVVGINRKHGIPPDNQVRLDTIINEIEYEIRINFYEFDEDGNPKGLVYDLDSSSERIQQVMVRARWLVENPQVYFVGSRFLSVNPEEAEFHPDHLAYAAISLLQRHADPSGSAHIGPIEITEPPGNPRIN